MKYKLFLFVQLCTVFCSFGQDTATTRFDYIKSLMGNNGENLNAEHFELSTIDSLYTVLFEETCYFEKMVAIPFIITTTDGDTLHNVEPPCGNWTVIEHKSKSFVEILQEERLASGLIGEMYSFGEKYLLIKSGRRVTYLGSVTSHGKSTNYYLIRK